MSSKVPEFFARPERLEQLADEAWREGRQLDRLAQETRDVTDRLKMLTQMEQPLHQLARCCAAMQEQAAALGRMSRRWTRWQGFTATPRNRPFSRAKAACPPSRRRNS